MISSSQFWISSEEETGNASADGKKHFPVCSLALNSGLTLFTISNFKKMALQEEEDKDTFLS